MRYSLLAALILSVCTVVSAQMQMFQRLSAPISKNGAALELPFTGGLNNPQFNPADLNNDGVEDLVIFDRGGNVILTFVNRGIAGETSYDFVPEYACFFPKLVDFVVMRDFNQDGAADIFCSGLSDGSQEMQVFQGYFDNNVLKFVPYKFNYPGCDYCDPLEIWYPSLSGTGNWSNLPIAKSDVPAIDDIDGDGDLDLVSFAAGNTTNLWMLRNESVELGYGLDSLKFRLVDVCWGRFFENGLEGCRARLSCHPDSCGPCSPEFMKEIADDRGNRHPGATVLTYDQDADGDKDLIFGNISYECLSMLTNGGDSEKAWMTSQDTIFPAYNTTVALANFPAAFLMDMDNDGKKDLVAAPNTPAIGEDRSCVWFYKNTASTGYYFELQTKSLLVDKMFDVGTATHPAFADVNADGLLDLVVGNNGYFVPVSPGNNNSSSLYLLLNTGTPTEPRFDLADSDWLGMSEYAPADYDFSPAFGDLDGDGDLDLLVGSYGGALFYYRNTAGPNNPMTFQQDFNPMWASMKVGSSSTPAVVDLDGDGLKDVVMGEYQGNINFYKNTGSATSPLFSVQPTLTKIGNIDTDLIPGGPGYSAPVFLETPDGLQLAVGGINGQIELYDNPTATNDAYSVVSLNWGNVDDGNRSCPAFADLDNDGILEMVVGNQRGGLSLYKTVLVDCEVPVKTQEPNVLHLSVSPNPACDWVQVQIPSEAPARWRAFNALGQLTASGETSGGVLQIAVSHWQTGVYFLEVIADGQRGVAKLVVRR
ncbi:MAG: hypothetical protein OHK0019_12720 [Saprospiraceae bacterium]